jgi:hypothetical protein
MGSTKVLAHSQGNKITRKGKCLKELKGGFFLFLFFMYIMYIIQPFFIFRPSDLTVSEDAGIAPRTVATLALTARRSNRKFRKFLHQGERLRRSDFWIVFYELQYIFSLVKGTVSRDLPINVVRRSPTTRVKSATPGISSGCSSDPRLSISAFSYFST